MQPEGLKAFEKRVGKKSGLYSYENAAELDEAYEQQFRANKKAWDFFQARPASYRRAAIWWVVPAGISKLSPCSYQRSSPSMTA